MYQVVPGKDDILYLRKYYYIILDVIAIIQKGWEKLSVLNQSVCLLV